MYIFIWVLTVWHSLFYSESLAAAAAAAFSASSQTNCCCYLQWSWMFYANEIQEEEEEYTNVCKAKLTDWMVHIVPYIARREREGEREEKYGLSEKSKSSFPCYQFAWWDSWLVLPTTILVLLSLRGNINTRDSVLMYTLYYYYLTFR